MDTQTNTETNTETTILDRNEIIQVIRDSSLLTRQEAQEVADCLLARLRDQIERGAPIWLNGILYSRVRKSQGHRCRLNGIIRERGARMDYNIVLAKRIRAIANAHVQAQDAQKNIKTTSRLIRREQEAPLAREQVVELHQE